MGRRAVHTVLSAVISTSQMLARDGARGAIARTDDQEGRRDGSFQEYPRLRVIPWSFCFAINAKK
jgi:hypothetical protein